MNALPSPLPTARTRVLVIGMDMGDATLIQRWVREGHLPNFAQLLREGSWWDLETPAEVLHTATWPTFATGSHPGKHGVYYPFQPRPGAQLAQHVTANQYSAPVFWSLADAQGLRCIVYDVPETFPTQEYKGRAIFELGTWAWYGQPESQPAGLLDELRSKFGRHPLKLEATRLGLKFPEPAQLQRRLIESIEHKTRSLRWLLGAEDWDLAVVGFCETHPTGHYLWPKNGSADDADDRLAAVRSIYVALDKALAELRQSLPDGTAILVVSGDGVRANHCGWHLLPEVLERLGYSVPVAAGPDSGRGWSLRDIKNAVPPGLRRWIADHLPSRLRDKINVAVEGAGLDWSRTRAFTLPTDLEGYIRINLKGREPEGVVAPGQEYQDLCREIAARLGELSNPASGRATVRKTWLRDEVFPGPAQEHLPDLIVTWDGAAPVEAVSSPRIGTVARPSPDPRTGTHSPSAFMLARGAGFRAGERSRGRLEDVAATVLDLLGVPADHSMDGRTLASGRDSTGERH